MQLSTKLKFTTVLLLIGFGLLLSVSPTWAVGEQCLGCPSGFHAHYIYQTCCKNSEVPECSTETDPINTCSAVEICQFSNPSDVFSGTCVMGDIFAECGETPQSGQVCPPECPYDSGTNTCKVATSLSCGSICTTATAHLCPATCPCKQTIPYKDMYCGTPPPAPGPGPGPSGDCIPTGLGCIPTDPTGLVEKILQIAIGVSSGIALLLLISGAFKVLASSGDPKAVMSGKETITSAIAGLLLILLSLAILRIIGFDILGIPFFERG